MEELCGRAKKILQIYGDMKFKAYTYMDGFDYLKKDKDDNYVKYDDSNKYSASDSPFLFKKGGISATIGFDNDFFKSVNVFAGVDNGNKIRMMETLIGQANFADDFVATLAFGVKHYKETDFSGTSGCPDLRCHDDHQDTHPLGRIYPRR